MIESDRTGGVDILLKLRDLQVHFPIGRRGLLEGRAGLLRAVDGVDLEIRRGETLGLVGESGSGKTTLGRALLRAIEPTAGSIRYDFDGERGDLRDLGHRALRQQWRRMQMIFQDPYSSLNPRMTVRDVIAEPLVANRLARGKALDRQVREIAGLCGLRADHLGRFPHAFSGGQRQRIAIARALVMRPLFIVCDEPVSALDVSIQAQILNLLKELQQELSLTYLFIAHDLAAVAYASDRVAVMYLGQIVELAPTERLYYEPRHPYTEALMSAIPAADPDERMAPVLLQGERPSPANPPSGCRFHTRCRYAQPRCSSEAPALREIAPGHLSACHFAETLTLKGAKELADGAAAAAPLATGQAVKNTAIAEQSR